METLHDPHDITEAFVQRRTRELEPENEPTGNDFVDQVIGFGSSVASDIWQSVRTGETADGVMLGMTEATHRGMNFIFSKFDSPAARLGEIVTGTIAGAAKSASEDLETGTAQIAADASPYVIFGTAAVLGGASLAGSLGFGMSGKILMALGGGAVSDFTVGATMEDVSEDNLADLLVQIAEVNPNSETLGDLSAVFEFLATEEDDSDTAKRLKRGATEALTSIGGELGFFAIRGSKAGVEGALNLMKKVVGADGLADDLVAMGRRGAALEQEVLAFDGPQITQFYERLPSTPLAVEHQISRGAERLGNALKIWQDRVEGATAAAGAK